MRGVIDFLIHLRNFTCFHHERAALRDLREFLDLIKRRRQRINAMPLCGWGWFSEEKQTRTARGTRLELRQAAADNRWRLGIWNRRWKQKLVRTINFSSSIDAAIVFSAGAAQSQQSRLNDQNEVFRLCFRLFGHHCQHRVRSLPSLSIVFKRCLYLSQKSVHRLLHDAMQTSEILLQNQPTSELHLDFSWDFVKLFWF
jgi:hypothetical protein